MPSGELPPDYDFNNIGQYEYSFGSRVQVHKSFIPHHCPYSHYPVSRDWVDIDCNAVACINNRNKKCIIPSLAIIGYNGVCVNFHIKQEYIHNQNTGI
jgi:hypothetical protein